MKVTGLTRCVFLAVVLVALNGVHFRATADAILERRDQSAKKSKSFSGLRDNIVKYGRVLPSPGKVSASQQNDIIKERTDCEGCDTTTLKIESPQVQSNDVDLYLKEKHPVKWMPETSSKHVQKKENDLPRRRLFEILQMLHMTSRHSDTNDIGNNTESNDTERGISDFPSKHTESGLRKGYVQSTDYNENKTAAKEEKSGSDDVELYYQSLQHYEKELVPRSEDEDDNVNGRYIRSTRKDKRRKRAKSKRKNRKEKESDRPVKEASEQRRKMDEEGYLSDAREEQRFNRNYQELLAHIHGFMSRISASMEQVESEYKQVFNGTRFVMMNGARGVIQQLHVANRYTYDALNNASQFTRDLYTKAHQNRDAARRGQFSKDEPGVIEDTEIQRRNFRPDLERAQGEKRNADVEMQKVKRMEMDSMLQKSKVERLRYKLHENYGYSLFKDLYSQLTIAIDDINKGMRKAPLLYEVERKKFYLDHLKSELSAAQSISDNSRQLYTDAARQSRENYETYNRWRRGRNHGGHTDHNTDHGRSSGVTVDSYQYRELRNLVERAEKHAEELDNERTLMEIVIGPLISKLTAAMNSKNKKTSTAQMNLLFQDLEMAVKDFYPSLDTLRVYIGSHRNITRGKRCGIRVEGSGWIDDDDESDDMCEEEGSGTGDFVDVDENRTIRRNSPSDEDFVFEDDFIDTDHEIRLSPIGQLGVDVHIFITKLMDKNHKLDEDILPVEKALSGLREQWREIEHGMETVERTSELQRELTKALDSKARDFQYTKYKIRQVYYNITNLNMLDLDGAVEKSERALAFAQRQHEKPQDDGQANGKAMMDEIAKDIDFSDLLKAEREIKSNLDDIRNLRSVTIASCEKVGGRVSTIHSNLSRLRQKVETARRMLSSLQLSVSKSGKGHISVPVAQPKQEQPKSTTTTVRVCIKPTSLDGPVLTVVGNDSASYVVTLNGGEVTVYVYSKDDYNLGYVTLENYVTQDQWSTLELQRIGSHLNVTLRTSDGNHETVSKFIEDLDSIQPQPLTAYVGGVPESTSITSGSWEGCVGELSINGRALTIFRPDSEGNQPALCSSHCTTERKKLSAIFNGDGFIHHGLDPKEEIRSLSIRFSTRQKQASILYLSNSRERFYLNIFMHSGAIKLESGGSAENVVLLSLNGSVNDGQSHILKVEYRGGRMYPKLDGGDFSVESSKPTAMHDVQEGILVGAYVSNKRQFMNTPYSPLIGCIGEVSINGKRIFLADVAEVYNVYEGHCKDLNLWHSCTHWTEESKSISFGVVEKSNTVTLLVSRDSVGPLIYYAREGDYEIIVSMTADGIDVMDVEKEKREGMLVRPDKDQDLFTFITVTDDGSSVFIKAWDKSVKISYRGIFSWFGADTTKPHTIAVGQTTDGGQVFTGSVSQFAISNRIIDLSSYSSDHSLLSCERLKDEITIRPKLVTLPPEPFSCTS